MPSFSSSQSRVSCWILVAVSLLATSINAFVRLTHEEVDVFSPPPCTAMQELRLYYDDTVCSTSNYYTFESNVCYSEDKISFAVREGELRWENAKSATLEADLSDPTITVWTFYSDMDCQKRLHGIDAFTCNMCYKTSPSWSFSINKHNITSYTLAGSFADRPPKVVDRHVARRGRFSRPSSDRDAQVIKL